MIAKPAIFSVVSRATTTSASRRRTLFATRPGVHAQPSPSSTRSRDMRAISTTSAVRARARGVIVLAEITRFHAIDIGDQIRTRERRVLHGARERDLHDVR